MDLSKREKIGLTTFAIIILIVVSCMYFYKNRNESVEVVSKNTAGTSNPVADNLKQTSSPKDNTIEVYISGEIKKPGVYSLRGGDRAENLVDMAGGFTSKADTSALNLAMKLKDEDYIRVPTKLENTSNQNSISNTVTSGNTGGQALININTADKEQLMELPRIGDALAQRIIDYREQKGAFKDITDIDQVSGIGPKMIENIKDKITVH
jgi:competence protein ComEA